MFNKTAKQLTITLSNISFAYHPNSIPCLQNFNALIQSNKITLIKGSNGIGKSTILNLCTGLWDNYSGRIDFCGYDIRELPRKNWISQLAICLQRIPVFRDTLRNNITLDEPFDADRIQALISDMNFEADVVGMKDGLDTQLYHSGELSGGQVQKLGILRALYRNKNIIFFDEPTNHLDSQSKERFLQILHSLKCNKIVVIITHDPLLLSVADHCISL